MKRILVIVMLAGALAACSGSGSGGALCYGLWRQHNLCLSPENYLAC